MQEICETPTNHIEKVLEPYFSPKQIADRLGLSESTIIRMFQDEPGVIKLRRGLGRKRDYVTLRIPASVLQRVIASRSA